MLRWMGHARSGSLNLEFLGLVLEDLHSDVVVDGNNPFVECFSVLQNKLGLELTFIIFESLSVSCYYVT